MSQAMLEKTLNTFRITEVYFGGDGFRIYTPQELDQAQLGYSRHPNGTDLTGQNEGDWKREWIVIGYDTNLGDPYFVDTSSEKCPVLTAMHGAGAWEPYIISPALQNFLSSLEHLRTQSAQEDSLVEPDDSTITDRDWIKSLENEMNRLNAEHEFLGHSLNAMWSGLNKMIANNCLESDGFPFRYAPGQAAAQAERYVFGWYC